jgi:hypothetical protein
MKSARLHTGHVLEFPDDATDHEIHSGVRKALGLSPPPTPATAAEVNQSLQSLARILSITAQTLMEVANQGVETNKRLGELISTLQAPKRLIFDKKGRPFMLRPQLKRIADDGEASLPEA